MRQYKRPEAPRDPYAAQPLPVDEPVAVYYRQSSEAQIGNISTTLQTVDMVEHLARLGWAPEAIIMIDMDAGVSGTKTIEERPGMAHLFGLIEKREVGAVAAQDVDRFFRDITQIQSNIFIDACRRNNVLVLTPAMVYDFAHPTQGRFHMQMFRDEAQRSADYLEFQIKGRLLKSRQWRSERGLWSGRSIATGYMVDDRDRLPDGTHNPDYRKYVPFEPYAEVVRAYFRLFQAKDGCQSQTWQHIVEHGPFFPEFNPELVPAGFIWHCRLKHRSRLTGKLCPSPDGLVVMLTNVVYIGHWIHQRAIRRWDNHQPLVDLELFRYAFNRLSPTDFHGEPNPDYTPYRQRIRQPQHERPVERPTYGGLVYSDDLPDHPHHRCATVWNKHAGKYQYQLYQYPSRSNVWNIKTHIVDPIVDGLLLARLRATTLDEDLWQAALTSTQHGNRTEILRIESEIKQARSEQDNIIAGLGTLTNPTMVERAQAQFEAAERRIAGLEADLEEMRSSNRHQVTLLHARPALEKIINNWERVPRNERRNLFEEFAYHITISKISRASKRITVHWRDGSQVSQDVLRESRGFFWEDDDLELLRQMVEDDVDQVEILRTFPHCRWRTLQQRYAYHFGENGRWRKEYQGQRPYNRHTRWLDTREYQQENRPTTTTTSPDRYR